MNAYVNYLIEANIGLVAFLLFYILLLSNETNFNFKRAFLLVGIGASLLFPFAKFTTASNALPSISNVLPSYFLPEIVINANELSGVVVPSSVSYWAIALWIYLAIASLLLVILIIKVSRILSYLQKSHTTLLEDKFKIIESDSELLTFSFFHFIFIGSTTAFSHEEKQQIIKHEITHATKFHSFDILLVEFLKIIFWFNPVVYYFKSLFTSIHEFQADQLAVDKQDVNQYCNLLARVALQSADYPIANHFNNSLTLKRIAMMKTAKTKLSRWKMATIAPLLVGLFVFIACQDQVMNDIKEIASKSTMVDPENYSDQVKQMIGKLTAENPTKSFFVMELTEEDAQKRMEELEAEHKGMLAAVHVDNTNGDKRKFTIFERGERTQQLANLTIAEGEVFTIVEETATPIGGMTEFYKLIGSELNYPLAARQKNIAGMVFIEFVVTKNGDITDVKAVKGIGAGCDEEAVRVVRASEKWNAGKQRGVTVNQRMVLPIRFGMNNVDKNSANITIGNVSTVDSEFDIELSSETTNGKIKLTGSVKDKSGKPIAGMNIVQKGTTSGTITNLGGKFQLETESIGGELVFSYMGYKSKFIAF